MTILLHDLVLHSATSYPSNIAIVDNRSASSYEDLAASIQNAASGLVNLSVKKSDRVAIYLPKEISNVVATFGVAMAGGIVVPINPVLKSAQVAHILRDSGSKILVTSKSRVQALESQLADCSQLETIVLVDFGEFDSCEIGTKKIRTWHDISAGETALLPRLTESDIAAILYTSGSTGKPKGVVLSHRNIVVGAESVSSYLGNTPQDVILAMLPLSFDAGFSQLTTGFKSGAKVVLLDFLLPNDVVRACEKHNVSCLTGVPPLWMQLIDKRWPDSARMNIRYFANTGGKLPRETLNRLRELFPNAQPFSMYGLTESFRSTYLDPAEIDSRPDSIGKAIPNAEILVVSDNGEVCAANETGELVHLGPLVAQGYWNDPERTKDRFRPAPGQLSELPVEALAVWSGDTVRRDEDGFLYFVSRRDDMIKTSGYRVSPSEIEELAYDSGMVAEAVALGIPHKKLGQGILLLVKPAEPQKDDSNLLIAQYRAAMPAFMVPLSVNWCDELPRNSNGKIDRQRLRQEYADHFAEDCSI